MNFIDNFMRVWKIWEKSEKKIGGWGREKKLREFFFKRERVYRRYEFKKRNEKNYNRKTRNMI